MATSVAYTELQFVLSAVMCWVQGNVKFQVRLSDVNAFPFKSLMSVDNDAVNCVKGVNVLVGVKMAVVADEEELMVTFPETELFDASLRVKVLLVMVELSITSEKVTDIEVISGSIKVAPSLGEVDETVGAVVSTVNEVKVMVFPVFPATSVTVTVQSE